MEDTNVETCLRMLRTSGSDNEKFAGIMMVTKVIKAENCYSKMKLEIVDAIGWTFLARLMRTNNVPEGCPPTMYKAVALSILSSLCADPQVASKPEMKNQVSALNEIILSPPIDDKEDKDLLTDCYECLYGLAGSKTGQSYLINVNTVACLVEVVIEEKHGNKKALEILMLLAGCHGNMMWKNHVSASTKLINFLTLKFSQNKDASKFEWCTTLACFISTLDKEKKPQLASVPWLHSLIETLSQDLKNKLAVEHRQCLIVLVSEVVNKFNVNCLLPPFIEDAKTVLLVTHLVCIEVRMILENCTWEEIQNKTNLLCSNYMLLENIISHMTNGQSMGFEEKQVLQVHSSMVGAFNGILFFLDEVSIEKNKKWVDPVVMATVRVLGAWLAEETTALKETVYKLLPFIIELINISLYPTLANQLPEPLPSIESALQECEMIHTCNPAILSIDDKSLLSSVPNVDDNPESAQSLSNSDQSECSTGNSIKKSVKFSDSGDNVNLQEPIHIPVDILCFLLPGLCHLTSEDEPRKILVDHKIQRMLVDYFTSKWKDLEDNEQNQDEVKDSLASLCGVFLNLAVTEPQLISTDNNFLSLLKILYNYLPLTLYKSDHLIVVGNFTTLGLMLLKNQHTKDEDENREKFLTSCVSFFSRAFCVEEKKPGSPSLTVTEEYDKWWIDIGELWYLGIRALCACLKTCREIPGIILKSGWLVNLVNMLVKVKGANVDNDLRTVVLELLINLASHSNGCKDVLREKGGLEIARIYQCMELKKMLSTA